jgi:membrane protease YdiL (CAAX protease family)
VRVLLGLGSILVGLALGVAASLAFDDRFMSAVMLVLVVGSLGMAIEQSRQGGTFRAYGIVLHKHAFRLGGIAGLGAIAMVSTIALFAAVFGASFILVHPSLPFCNLATHIVDFSIRATAEEVIFRGTIAVALASRFGNPMAILITSTAFALGHVWNPGGIEVLAFVNVFLAGVLLGTMALTKASLLMAIIFHATWNVLLSLFFGTVSGIVGSPSVTILSVETMPESYRWLVSGIFGVEQGFVTTILLTVSTVMLYQWQAYDPVVSAARQRMILSEERLHSASAH